MPRAPEADERWAEDAALPESWYARREHRRVFLWRYWQARQLGVSPCEARRFAASEGDVEALRVLVDRRGCDSELAVEILA